jgi:2-keto-4-pentenoate hydratase/2-oxohepta-3-ene-1,7-dioic acid hydratase in catechol pathway
MRIASFVHLNGQPQVGLVSADGLSVTPLALSADEARQGVQSVIDRQAAGLPLPEVAGPAIALKDVCLDAPLPLPRRNLWCVGRNYHAHAKELQASVFKDNDANPEAWPIVFTKTPQTVIGPFDEVQLPHGVSEQIDYEAELAIVIGTGGKNIRRADALKHVFGYTVVNDVSARDVQMRHQQWDMGKSFDTFCPMGPWIVTAENMIFDIPTLIETISRGITLFPGDVIATGTPAGVGMGMKPPRYLQAGDVVRIEVDGLGVIENKFV